MYTSHKISVGLSGQNRVVIGGGESVVVQTMWKDRLAAGDIDAAVRRIQGLADMGCALLRFAVPDLDAADTLGALAGRTAMPLVADIHFDYKIALRCLDYPIAKIRINPGNIGSKERVKAVLDKAADKGVPIRIGVNAGSLPQRLRPLVEAGTLSTAEALVEAAFDEIALFEEAGFQDYLVSMKASSPGETVAANRLLAEKLGANTGTHPPLHVGVTEAGPLVAGTVRNTVALYELLKDGIGDTIRVSLSDTMENEVIAAREILNTVQETTKTSSFLLPPSSLKIVSCPRCGRHSFDSIGFTTRWLERLYKLPSSATVAIMGCAVNGPQEAKHADLGITGAGSKALIFRHGAVVRTIDATDADAVFEEELARL
jgi:(E)-4-hydroxy-3-methylbut-2-enyl-diphosphate synthase